VIPVLWLCGPPGVGKTEVGWRIYSQLAQKGIPAGFADIDQLGMCYPEPADDQGRHKIKARNLGAILPNFRRQGARCMVVSGVTDPSAGVPGDYVSRATLTVCRLRADHDELRRRFLRRSPDGAAAESVLREADALDASGFADVIIDTTGITLADVVSQVLALCGGWPALIDEEPEVCPSYPASEVPGADGPILFLCGPTGVGKSTAGFEVYLRDLRAGLTAAYIDLDQIGYCRPQSQDDPGGHLLKARNLAVIWQHYRALGAERLVVVGPAENEKAAASYAAALPRASITLCRLHAQAEVLTRRIMLRGAGGGSWPQPGDPLIGQPAAQLRHIAALATASADEMERGGPRAIRVGTDGLTVQETADLIDARSGWHVRGSPER